MTDTVFGLPLSGDISYYNERISLEQYPIEQLQPYIQAMLDDPEVAKFGWIQYTPYFNDGEACVFGVHGCFVLTNEDVAKLKEDNEYDGEYFSHWDYEVRSYAYGDEPKSPQHHIDFSDAIGSGHFFQALEHTFGDPAEVVITKEGITVEAYDHE